MILSHSRKFIFIKTAKTAGTSFEVMFSPHAGPDDVLTPIGGEDEERREKGCGPRNHRGFFNPLPLLWQGPTWRRRKAFTKVFNRKKFYQHMAGYEIKSRVSKEVWDEYFKFCVVRNPWDQAVSGYYFLRGLGLVGPDESFRDYLLAGCLKSDWYLYTIDDEIIVDRVLRFESLTEDLADISERIGISKDEVMPRRKSQHRPNQADYRDHYDDTLRDLVGEIFHREIEAFEYRF